MMNYKIKGRVVSGNSLGQSLGFPTANILPEVKVDIEEGVYVGVVEFNDKIYGGVFNIGRSPSVISDGEQRIEVHIIDFSGDIYGENITIILNDFLRKEQKFASLSELKAQIARDKESAIKLLSILGGF